MPAIDWNAEASGLATRFQQEMFEVLRAAVPWRMRGYVVVFGNDGYEGDSSERAKRTVNYLRGFFPTIDAEEMGFGTSAGSGYSWAMIVRTSADPEALTDVVFRAWDFACADMAGVSAEVAAVSVSMLAESYQMSIAKAKLPEFEDQDWPFSN